MVYQWRNALCFHLICYLQVYASMDTERAFKRYWQSNLVFYAQSTITVISGKLLYNFVHKLTYAGLYLICYLQVYTNMDIERALKTTTGTVSWCFMPMQSTITVKSGKLLHNFVHKLTYAGLQIRQNHHRTQSENSQQHHNVYTAT